MRKALRAYAIFDARLTKIVIKSEPKAANQAQKKGVHF
jgi:hypothetical protein